MFGDRTKKPLPIAVRAVAVNSKTGGKLKLKNSLIRITSWMVQDWVPSVQEQEEKDASRNTGCEWVLKAQVDMRKMF